MAAPRVDIKTTMGSFVVEVSSPATAALLAGAQPLSAQPLKPRPALGSSSGERAGLEGQCRSHAEALGAADGHTARLWPGVHPCALLPSLLAGWGCGLLPWEQPAGPQRRARRPVAMNERHCSPPGPLPRPSPGPLQPDVAGGPRAAAVTEAALCHCSATWHPLLQLGVGRRPPRLSHSLGD